MNEHASRALFARAQARIVGGVNSPSRSYDSVGGGTPRFVARGAGAYVWDEDGERYIDYLAAYGAMILGHAHPLVVSRVQARIADGSVFGTPNPLEVELAERLSEAIPALERLRFVVSGTEAVMTALRVARAYTGREKVVKFSGSYHGHADPVLVSAGSGTSTLGLEESAGIPSGVKADVISVPFNDRAALAAVFDRWGAQIAALLIEPIVGNFGMIPPFPGYLAEAAELAHRHGALVIWDEVITAFRFRWGSVQAYLDLAPESGPDLITLGKLIGGGLPIGAYGGRREVMRVVTPEGPVYQDGTFAGNPLSMAAGLACLDALASDPGLYDRLARYAQKLAATARAAAARLGLPLYVSQVGGAFSIHFCRGPVHTFADAQAASSEQQAVFFHALLARGILTAPSKYEAWFVSAAHSEADIAETAAAIEEALAAVAHARR